MAALDWVISGEVTFKQKLLRPEKIRREFPAEEIATSNALRWK